MKPCRVCNNPDTTEWIFYIKGIERIDICSDCFSNLLEEPIKPEHYTWDCILCKKRLWGSAYMNNNRTNSVAIDTGKKEIGYWRVCYSCFEENVGMEFYNSIK